MATFDSFDDFNKNIKLNKQVEWFEKRIKEKKPTKEVLTPEEPYTPSKEAEAYFRKKDREAEHKIKPLANKLIKGIGIYSKSKDASIDGPTYEFIDETKEEEDLVLTATKPAKKKMSPKAPGTPIKNDLEKEAEKLIGKLKAKDAFLLEGEEATIKNVDKSKDTVTLKTRFGEETKSLSELKELFTDKKLLTQKEASTEKQNTIEEIARFVKEHGIDRIVVHGEPRFVEEDGEKILKTSAELDFDTQIALYFLNYNQNFTPDAKGKLPKNIYNPGADTELVMKGESTSGTKPVWRDGEEKTQKLKKGSFVFHVDTGQRTLSIKQDGKIVMAFADHHAQTDSIKTSAAEMVLNIMKEAGQYKPEPWMENLAKFTNEVDNLSYADNLEFKEGYFKNEWPRTLHALHEFLPYQKVIELLKEKRNPYKPFTDAELASIIVKQEVPVLDDKKQPVKDKNGKVKKEWKDLPLSELVAQRTRDSATSLKRLGVAGESMKAQGILSESPLVGKAVYSTLDAEVDAAGNTIKPNYIPEAFLAVKAKGYDTFITYSKEKNTFFVNSTTKDLRPIIKEIQKIVPGARLIRGVMIVPGKDDTGKDQMTKEKLLQICGLINKNTKLYERSISDKEMAKEKEKERIILEQKISDLEKKVKEKMRNVEILEQDAKMNDAYLQAIKEEIEEIEREAARIEENTEMKETLTKARKKEMVSTPKAPRAALSTEPVKPTEALVRYEAPMKAQLKWLNDEEIVQNKKLVEERLKEIAGKTYTKEDLHDARKEKDLIDADRRMHKLRKGEDKDYGILTAKLEIAQRIYSTIEKKLRESN